MICYLDRTFCTSSDICNNKSCGRLFTKEHQQKATEWMGDSAPICYGDFKDTNKCIGFIQKDS